MENIRYCADCGAPWTTDRGCTVCGGGFYKYKRQPADELEPADAPAPAGETSELDALRVNPLTDAGALLAVNLKLRGELNAEKEKRMDSEAGAYNLYSELCDVKEENRSHLRRLDAVTAQLEAAEREVVALKQTMAGYMTAALAEAAELVRERDAARTASKAWKAAAKLWYERADFAAYVTDDQSQKTELRAALAETHEHYKDLALILRRNGIVPLNYEAMDARDIANEKLLKGDQS